MATDQELSQAAKDAKQKLNPAGATPVARGRIPMSTPLQRLQVPDVPGHRLHWMRGDSTRIQQAINAGYEFVSRDEIQTNSFSLGGDAKKDGNTDLGTRVSISAGHDSGEDGQPLRLYLMKIKQELWDEDQAVLARRNAEVAHALLGGVAPGQVDPGHAYVDAKRTKVPDFFRPKVARGR